MKKRLLIALLASLTISTVARATTPTTGPINDAVAADNALATDIYAQLRQTTGNICVSPYSLASALDMVSAGAQGQTATQMLGVLHWTEARADLPTAAAALSADILKKDLKDKRAAQIQIANALFGQTGYPYRQEFLDLLSKQYTAALQPVDYINHPADALAEINQWAAKSTSDKIKEALPPGAITPLTRLVLVNAVYFKGEWIADFSREATQDQPFHVDAGKSVNVPLMQRQSSFGYMEDDKLQAVELRYHGDFSMAVVLPRATDGLPALEESLTAETLGAMTAQMKNESVNVSLPRFKIEGDYDMNQPLIKLGMTDAFNGNADFSGIASLEKLKIDKVQQKTFISVDEAGTEAAAVTSVKVGAMAVRTPREVATFRADHPFLFVLRQRSTGAILFIGRCENP